MDVGCPESITEERGITSTTFTRKHFSSKAFGLLLFCIVWDGFLFFWYFGVESESMPLVAKLFPIGHIAVGIGLTYYTITLFINKTEINISNGVMKIRDYPLPLGNSKILNCDDFKQFYVKEKISNNDDSTSVSYILMGIKKDNKLKKIISGLHEKEEGLYLEQEIEKILKIKPENVKGEVQ